MHDPSPPNSSCISTSHSLREGKEIVLLAALEVRVGKVLPKGKKLRVLALAHGLAICEDAEDTDTLYLQRDALLAALNPSAEDYLAEDLPKIRAAVPELAGLFDESVEYLYRLFSEESACAGWLAGPQTERFRRWATTSPIERLRRTQRTAAPEPGEHEQDGGRPDPSLSEQPAGEPVLVRGPGGEQVPVRGPGGEPVSNLNDVGIEGKKS